MLVDLLLLPIIKFFQQVLRLLPESWVNGIGAFLGRVAMRFLHWRREIAVVNVRKIDTSLSDEQARSVVRRCFEKLGINLMEQLLMPYVPKEAYEARFKMESAHHIEEALRMNKGLLALGFHYANWEITGVTSHQIGREIITLARPLKGHRLLDRFLNNLRASTGLTVIPNRDTARDVMRYLRENKVVAILGDQREKSSKAVYVEFFGEKVPTRKGIIAIAMRTGSPIVPIYMRREGFLRYTVVYGKPIVVERKGNADEVIHTNARKINAFLEEIVKADPSEWFLVHRRFGKKSY